MACVPLSCRNRLSSHLQSENDDNVCFATRNVSNRCLISTLSYRSLRRHRSVKTLVDPLANTSGHSGCESAVLGSIIVAVPLSMLSVMTALYKEIAASAVVLRQAHGKSDDAMVSVGC
jgi:hypothetical protein